MAGFNGQYAEKRPDLMAGAFPRGRSVLEGVLDLLTGILQV